MRTIELSDHVATRLIRASYLRERRALPWITGGLGLLSVLALAAALGGRRVLGATPRGLWWLVLVLAVLALGCGAAIAYYEMAYRRSSPLRAQLQAGLAGQQVVPRHLAGLDDSYYLINNLKLPGRADDIDHVVVGPSGVFALEIKHHRGRIYWRDGQWYQAKRSRAGRLQPEAALRDPTQQLKRNIDYLRTCINHTDRALSRRTRLWVEGAVVFTSSEARIDLPPEVVARLAFPVLRARDLPATITRNIPRHRLARGEVCRVVSLLANLHSPPPYG